MPGLFVVAILFAVITLLAAGVGFIGVAMKKAGNSDAGGVWPGQSSGVVIPATAGK